MDLEIIFKSRTEEALGLYRTAMMFGDVSPIICAGLCRADIGAVVVLTRFALRGVSGGWVRLHDKDAAAVLCSREEARAIASLERGVRAQLFLPDGKALDFDDVLDIAAFGWSDIPETWTSSKAPRPQIEPQFKIAA